MKRPLTDGLTFHRKESVRRQKAHSAGEACHFRPAPWTKDTLGRALVPCFRKQEPMAHERQADPVICLNQKLCQSPTSPRSNSLATLTFSRRSSACRPHFLSRRRIQSTVLGHLSMVSLALQPSVSPCIGNARSNCGRISYSFPPCPH